MEAIIIFLIAIFAMVILNGSSSRGGGCCIKEKPKTKRPDVLPRGQL